MPIALMFLPSDYFDNDDDPICPSRLFFGVKCPGCGTTRATMHMIHFEFQKAWNYNKWSFILVPLLCFLYLRLIWLFYKKVKRTLSNNSQKPIE